MFISMIPVRDRYSLILVQKLSFILVFSIFFNNILSTHSLSISNEQISLSNKYILKIENYIDYSFDKFGECQNVQINLENEQNPEKINGILHSPDYRLNIKEEDYETLDKSHDFNLINNTKCKWIINAPENYDIQLNLIELDSKSNSNGCPNEKLEFSLPSNEINLNKKLWINLIDTETKSQNLKNYTYEKKNSISTCEIKLRSFLIINTNSNTLEINYKTFNSNMNFLLSFSLIKTTKNFNKNTNSQLNKCLKKNDEIKCEIDINTSNKTYKHYSCIKKDLICNCLSLKRFQDNLNKTQIPKKQIDFNYMDNCDYLIESFDSYLLSLKHDSNAICEYYSRLNSKCRNDKTAFKKGLDLFNVYNPENSIDLYEDYGLPTEIETQPEITSKPHEFKEPSLNDVCYNVIKTNEFGWIASPNFYSLSSKDYDYNTNCSYHIMVQSYQTIQIRFKYFYLNPNLFDLNSIDYQVQNASTRRSKSSKNSKKSSELFKPNTDYDFLTIYDGPNTNSPVLAKFSALNNDFKTNFYSKVFNSKTNFILIQFHSQMAPFQEKNSNRSVLRQTSLMGFNLTYQIKGYCIDNQKQCNSPYDLNCYSPEQACNDVWDCQNGADERGCEPCALDQYKCKNKIFCYRLEDRCDGDHQCIDKSDEMNCDKWNCNSDNGTFLCNNGRCVYEYWVCDGTNDCEDGSDEINCPSGLTSRRVITTAVLGGTLCCLLLVMALGCACKLYTLHTATYRSSIRLSQHMSNHQSSLINNNLVPTIAGLTSSNHSSNTNTSSRTRRRTSRHRSRNSVYNNLSSFIRRLRTNTSNTSRSETTTALLGSTETNILASQTQPSSIQNNSNQSQNSTPIQFSFNNELPLPHHLIAPPTYNQTMGLVDEYEQRQLAFIEHVRTILSQQQNGSNIINLGNGNQISSMSIIPTVTSSSTTVHRVTSSSGRRSHSTRHHRHHYHHRNSNSSETNTASNSETNNHHRHRSHRHRSHRSHQSGSGSTTTNSQISFDLNRRGLNLETSTLSTNQESIQERENQQDRQMVIIPECSRNEQNTEDHNNELNTNTTTNTTTTNNNNKNGLGNNPVNNNSTSANSVNLRDRIAKLIKDIVVHHGDNIQYVQLAEHGASSSIGHVSNLNEDTNSIESNLSNQENNSSESRNRREMNDSARSSSNTNNLGEDDMPLIQP